MSKKSLWVIAAIATVVIGGYLLIYKKASAENQKASLGPWIIADPDTGLWSNMVNGSTAQINKISYMSAYWRNDSDIALTGSITIHAIRDNVATKELVATAGNNVSIQPGAGNWVSFELSPVANESGTWSMTASVMVAGQVKDSRTVSITVV